MFFEWSSTRQTIFFLLSAHFDWLPWQPKSKKKKCLLKNHLLTKHMEYRAEAFQKYSLYLPLQILCFSLLLLKSYACYGDLKLS